MVPFNPCAKWAETATPKEIERTMQECSELELKNCKLQREVLEANERVAEVKRDKQRYHDLKAEYQGLEVRYHDLMEGYVSYTTSALKRSLRLEDEVKRVNEETKRAQKELAKIKDLQGQRPTSEFKQKAKHELRIRDKLIVDLKKKVKNSEGACVEQKWKALLGTTDRHLAERESRVEEIEEEVNEKNNEMRILNGRLHSLEVRNPGFQTDAGEIGDHLDRFVYQKEVVEDKARKKIRELEKQIKESRKDMKDIGDQLDHFIHEKEVVEEKAGKKIRELEKQLKESKKAAEGHILDDVGCEYVVVQEGVGKRTRGLDLFDCWASSSDCDSVNSDGYSSM
ncbi:hypothetical protein P152DRAFT_490205 [Eremomyces bilateralis CBS 781.70]|uniref:Uncharacterized protein n=1 Tax=Eremomyces bilateralis CBS 781.70 TaxID=1392243 RepID=A0A6G1FZK7_9PEZI|nr:uncharacterized protein P152DRAFT_490205 [Eremomyces bilateralis CBS 781.70]KAF1811100.1 hypothetical protein P152DRAFT_490205 [Eremomyces bilateralis CBS 781.70]